MPISPKLHPDESKSTWVWNVSHIASLVRWLDVGANFGYSKHSDIKTGTFLESIMHPDWKLEVISPSSRRCVWADPSAQHQAQRDKPIGCALQVWLCTNVFILHYDSLLICDVRSGNGKTSMSSFEGFFSAIGAWCQCWNLLYLTEIFLEIKQN